MFATVYIVPLSFGLSYNSEKKIRQVDLIDIETRVLYSYYIISFFLSLCCQKVQSHFDKNFVCVFVSTICPVVHLLISLSPGIYSLHNILYGRVCERSQKPTGNATKKRRNIYTNNDIVDRRKDARG